MALRHASTAIMELNETEKFVKIQAALDKIVADNISKGNVTFYLGCWDMPRDVAPLLDIDTLDKMESCLKFAEYNYEREDIGKRFKIKLI